MEDERVQLRTSGSTMAPSRNVVSRSLNVWRVSVSLKPNCKLVMLRQPPTSTSTSARTRLLQLHDCVKRRLQVLRCIIRHCGSYRRYVQRGKQAAAGGALKRGAQREGGATSSHTCHLKQKSSINYTSLLGQADISRISGLVYLYRHTSSLCHRCTSNPARSRCRHRPLSSPFRPPTQNSLAAAPKCAWWPPQSAGGNCSRGNTVQAAGVGGTTTDFTAGGGRPGDQ